ncbi:MULTISPECIES: hypothetical protein [Cyanophyceae]|uniref:hypothetical protein n=1 Tax=Cyanophyceae TaxID=3028117 RepID=UPI00232E192F|nr:MULTISPECIES: hypothetical protein [Cyanophyceae]MDB9355380.1 hypothetical protein [Nodularia spumigena CS-587/03]MDB9338795.1 hypothetical protein [Nodularia spumigena CS-589/07]MDB9343187.1 hypothetical protein [Nodularia spumigena CS-588/06]MDB9348689.1 hypothetical protein [Nodularia spumigena CS-588/01]MDB9351501.1 hypothetical protein [Nodularia spumigena CS-588/05]
MKAKVKKKNYGLWLLASGLWLVAANSMNNSAFANTPVLLTQTKAVKNGLSSTCSEQSLETLTPQLLQDLPSYANRISQRARRRRRSSDIYSYVLVAGKPEFQPLPINSGANNTDGQKSTTTGVEQVFFTTLERQYIAGKIVESQQFHWLLFTKSNSGWRLVIMFTQIGSDSKSEVVSPPRDSSKGVIAQAVKTWLRDCQADSVRMRRRI